MIRQKSTKIGGISKRIRITLKMAMEAIDQRNSYVDVFAEYGIPKSSLRDHISEKTRSKKIGPQRVLTEEDKSALCEFTKEMIDQGMPLAST